MPFNAFGACCVLLYTRSSSIIQAQFTVTCDYVCPNDINGTLRSMRMYIYSMGHPFSQTIKLPKHPSKGSCLLLVLGQSVETVPSLMPCLLCFYGALWPVLSLLFCHVAAQCDNQEKIGTFSAHQATTKHDTVWTVGLFLEAYSH